MQRLFLPLQLEMRVASVFDCRGDKGRTAPEGVVESGSAQAGADFFVDDAVINGPLPHENDVV